ncbi:FtsX-like permease family protein [Leptotrichia sp. OH3620_COT-345]|uniref:cell division protein FtsX n=1 Tax=Leptotrichia sp. OH3620_COT-345 TaxID=2491048 RepID=UPI000F64EE8D|nr:permease-like cell division protein FtsX [Leptotrichia sp. OH3620_COT-345]RRD39777.1 FtsX-like permease family protein [Leptotrichia sp. OH3620_COT-345]
MFSPIQETFRNINKEKGLFFSSLISLITVFVLLDIFIFGVFNLNDFKAKMENSNQAIVYVKTMTEDEISQFQGKLLKINGIQTIKYVSKESAFQILEKELKVDLADEENPLQDSFYIYVDKNANVNSLKEELLKNSEVTELDMRAQMIEKTNKFSKSLDKLVLFGGIGSIVIASILIMNITSFGVRLRRKEIRDLIATGVSGTLIKLTYFLEGKILVALSSIIGFLVFWKLQKFIVEGINILHSGIVGNSTNRELLGIYLISLFLGFVITFFSNFIGLHGYYVSGKKEKKAKIKPALDSNTQNEENKE